VRAKEAAALNEPSSEAATGRRERVSALGASGGGLAAGPEKETVAGSGALRDRTLSRLARGSAFPESREPEGERLVFSQTRLADAKNAAQPVQQVLTLVDSDPAALARRAVLTANQEGLSASLALADERGAGAVEVYLTVPRAQYERLLAELSNLAPPGKQTLANTAEAKDAYLFQAKANYEQTQNARAGGGQGGVGYATAAPEKGLSAAGPEGGSRAALDSAHLDLSERLAAEAQPVGLLVRIGRPGTVSLEAR
jgi:hypothetical protein